MIAPVAKSKHSARNETSLFGPLTAVVRKTLPLDMTGDDQPRPGIGRFQATFLSGPHATGKRPFATIPCPVGPRNSGQSSAFAARTMAKLATSPIQARRTMATFL